MNSPNFSRLFLVWFAGTTPGLQRQKICQIFAALFARLDEKFRLNFALWDFLHNKQPRNWEFAKGGGAKRIVRVWGGERTIKCPLQNQFWRPQKMGFVWSAPVSSKEHDRA